MKLKGIWKDTQLVADVNSERSIVDSQVTAHKNIVRIVSAKYRQKKWESKERRKAKKISGLDRRWSQRSQDRGYIHGGAHRVGHEPLDSKFVGWADV